MSNKTDDMVSRSVADAMAKLGTRKVAEVDALMRIIAPAMREALRPLEARIERIESRAMHDAGVWSREAAYEAGAVCSHNGHAWVAKIATHAVEPGDGAIWRMLVRRPRDGRPR